MGLRCLLGHEFGEPATEREREERGDEVVITVRQVKTCERCGERRVVSENKEVTALEQLLDAADPDRTDREARTGPEAHPADAADAATAADADAEDAGGGGGAAFATDEFEPPRSAAEDDGVILDDEGEKPVERQPGEWPEADVNYPEGNGSASASAGGGARDASADRTRSDDGGERPSGGRERVGGRGDWPSADGEDEGYSAERAESGGPSDVSFGSGITPDRNDDAEERSASGWASQVADDVDRDSGSSSDSDPDSDFDADDRTGAPASAPDEDAELLDADSTDRGDALAPESGIVDREDDGAERESADGRGESGRGTASSDAFGGGTRRSSGEGETGFTRADSASISRSSPTAETGRRAFHCPECGLERPAGGSSLRAGDICPECRGGYITEREH